mmetsp:Transcript_7731/g.8513  ORF Transcript_7731/g.8513 Transcript_7731/m.8513 type:complete len:132 (+) Transcript_7731:915-1310(+)
MYGRTTVHKKTLSPFWSEGFNFEVKGPLKDKVIKFECRDKDKGPRKDSFLGIASVVLTDLIDQKFELCENFQELFDSLSRSEKNLEGFKLKMNPRPGKKDLVSGTITVRVLLDISDYEDLKTEEIKIDLKN